jgi:hypothetical protein
MAQGVEKKGKEWRARWRVALLLIWESIFFLFPLSSPFWSCSFPEVDAVNTEARHRTARLVALAPPYRRRHLDTQNAAESVVAEG